MNVQLSDQQYHEIFNVMDTDLGGEIEYEELIARIYSTTTLVKKGKDRIKGKQLAGVGRHANAAAVVKYSAFELANAQQLSVFEHLRQVGPCHANIRTGTRICHS